VFFTKGFEVKNTLFWKVLVLLLGVLGPAPSWAGPPFVTDDPEPVEYQHWEIFLATSYAAGLDGGSGSAPQFDINYGFLPEAHINLVCPFAFHSTDGESNYGYGDTELAVKFRFLKETDGFAQASLYPRVVFLTGDSHRGLVDGNVQAGLPFWLQKSFGPWTTYGGLAYWFHPGLGN
jgi:hypothetical protein